MNIHIIPLLRDNYAYLLEDGTNAVVIDPGEAEPVAAAIEARGLKLPYIINTHHHWDHTDGNLELKEKFGAQVVGPAAEADQIPGIDLGLHEGGRFEFLNSYADIIETPGHTAGHICLHMPVEKILFTGDTLFSMGCGRLFEGTPEDIVGSFAKILKLPDETNIYCGHEYTLPNGLFCAKVEPDNKDIQKRLAEAKELRQRGLPTLPVTLGTEKKTNVYLRAKTPEEFVQIRAKRAA